MLKAEIERIAREAAVSLAGSKSQFFTIDSYNRHFDTVTKQVATAILTALDAQSAELAALKARLEAVEKAGGSVIDICNQESSWVEIGKRLDALAALLKGTPDGNPA